LVGLLSLGESVSVGAYSPEDLVVLTTMADEAAAVTRSALLLAREWANRLEWRGRDRRPGGRMQAGTVVSRSQRRP
jgi:hypothetical protein